MQGIRMSRRRRHDTRNDMILFFLMGYTLGYYLHHTPRGLHWLVLVLILRERLGFDGVTAGFTAGLILGLVPVCVFNLLTWSCSPLVADKTIGCDLNFL